MCLTDGLLGGLLGTRGLRATRVDGTSPGSTQQVDQKPSKEG